MFEEQPFGRPDPVPGNPDQNDGPSVCEASCAFEEGALQDLVSTPEQKKAFEVMAATSAFATVKAESMVL